MTRRNWIVSLVVICLVGLVMRLFAWRIEPPLHPDEYYQYIEPAWLRMNGIGVEPWEWRDGIRSWVLPGYNGGWLALLTTLGVSGPTSVRIVQLHWALISMVLVWAGYRGGAQLSRQIMSCHAGVPAEALEGRLGVRAGWQGGLLGAAMCAWFPLLVMQSPHTLSEAPSMFTLVISLVLALEALESGHGRSSVRAATISGFCAALGVCLRIANGPLALISFAVLLKARQFRLALAFVVAGCIPVVLFGIVDKVTWGGFLSSYIGYIRFNFLEGRAAEFGVMPGNWYWRIVIERLPTLVAVFAFILYSWRRVAWPYLLATIGLLAYLTTQGHKEERFIVAFWPFFLIGVSGVVGAKLAVQEFLPVPERGLRRLLGIRLQSHVAQVALAFALVSATTVDSLVHSARAELDIMSSLESRTHASRGLVAAQAWVGRRDDVVGVLIQEMGAGYAGLGAMAPMLVFDRAVRQALVLNPVLNYAIVEIGSSNIELVQGAGYSLVKTIGNYEVFRRTYESEGVGPDLDARRRTRGKVKAAVEQARKLELVAKRAKHAL